MLFSVISSIFSCPYSFASQALAQIRTVASSIQNMIKGVKYGYRFVMKSVYAHFPINLTFTGNKQVQVRNFLGEKVVRDVDMLDGVTVRASGEKDEIYVEVRVEGWREMCQPRMDDGLFTCLFSFLFP